MDHVSYDKWVIFTFEKSYEDEESREEYWRAKEEELPLILADPHRIA